MQPINPNVDIEIKGNCTNFTCCFPFPKKKKKDQVTEQKINDVSIDAIAQSQTKESKTSEHSSSF